MVQYSRSLSIIDNYMYIPDGCNGNIFKVDYLNNWDLIEVYTVPNDIAGLNYITKIDDYFYLTTTCGYEFDMSKSPVIVRAKSIDEICDNNYENITSQFNLNGIPYYITYFDKHYFLSVIDPENQNGICQFDIKNNHIKNVKYIMNFETVDDISKIRKEEVFN
jgi:hypothetical protein